MSGYRVLMKFERPNVCASCAHALLAWSGWVCTAGVTEPDEDAADDYPRVNPWGTCAEYGRGEPQDVTR
jgi:hypothetical protein